MSDIRYINVQFEGVSQTLAMSSGISAGELEGVIRSIFDVKGNVVGFQAQNTGLVVPLSLACRNANSLPGTSFTLLTSGGSSRGGREGLPLPPAPPASKAVAIRASTGVVPPVNPPAPPTRAQLTASASDSLASSRQQQQQRAAQEEESQEADDAMDELLRFIAALRIKQMLTKAEADALEELLFENSTLIYAAYSVAKSAGDPKYLATVCRDIAQSLMTDMGRAGCAAQDEVLQYCDRLFVANRITENQLLYMRHMVLIRDDVVATLYDDFQRHRSPDRFAMELFRLANTHPRWIDGDEEEDDEEEVEEGESDDDDDESEKVLTSAVYPHDENRAAVLTGIVSLMNRAGGLTPTENSILRHLIDGENDYVTAAYELFQQDGDVEELEDTLLRISRLEIARSESSQASIRSSARQEADEAAARVESRRSAVSSASGGGNPFGRQAQTPAVPAVAASTAAASAYYQDNRVDSDDDEDEESSASEQSEEEETVQGADKGAQKYVENFLAGLGVRNTWDSSVPDRFIVAVFATAQKGLLTVGQARALCDLYQARYDLVLAAWEVFTVQADVPDLMDTLLRIVRGLNFNSNGELMDSKNMISGYQSEEGSEEEEDEESESDDDDESESEEEPPARSILTAPAAAAVTPGDAARREVAIKAVAQAKHDLLRHSLEMMVKQGIAPADKAAALFQRALEGDVLIDAAIEAYANDRNVADFLDTLNILLSHSPAELDSIMQSAMARQAGASGAAPVATTEGRVDSNTGRMPVGAAPVGHNAAAPGGQVAPRFPAAPSAPASAAEAEEADLDAAQLQLREIVSELADRDILSPVGRTILIKLVITRDDRVMGAHDEYRESGDLGDLVDSLIRIARLEQANPTAAAAAAGTTAAVGKSSEDTGIEMSSLKKQAAGRNDADLGFEMSNLGHGQREEDDDDEDDGIDPFDVAVDEMEEAPYRHPGQASGIHPLSRAGSMDSLPSSPATASVTKSPGSSASKSPATKSPLREETVPAAPLLTMDDQQSILDILNNAGALSNTQYAALLRLLKVGDRRLYVVFQQYEQDKDVHGLIARLGDVSQMLVNLINEEAAEEAAEAAAERGSNNSDSEESGSESGGEDDDDEEEEEDDDELEEDDKDSIEAIFLGIVQNMKLNHLETAALRLAIARDDKQIRACLEDFRLNRSESKLMDGLHEIARSTIDTTLLEAGYDGFEGDDRASGDAGDADADDDEKEWVNQQQGDDEDDDEESDSDSDDSSEDERQSGGGNGLMSTQATRERVFPLLISELSKESILTAEEARKLYTLFVEKNDVLNSALDVYDLDNNIAELVDTMLRLAKVSN